MKKSKWKGIVSRPFLYLLPEHFRSNKPPHPELHLRQHRQKEQIVKFVSCGRRNLERNALKRQSSYRPRHPEARLPSHISNSGGCDSDLSQPNYIQRCPEGAWAGVLDIPPQQVRRQIVAASCDVASNLVRQIGRSRLDFGEKIGGSLVETVNVELELLGGVCDGLLNGHAAVVNEHGDNAVNVAVLLDTETAR